MRAGLQPAMRLSPGRGSGASRQTDRYGIWEQRTGAPGVCEALQDLLPTSGRTGSERDAAVEIDPQELSRERAALRPACIRRLLLWRVRQRARPEDHGESA